MRRSSSRSAPRTPSWIDAPRRAKALHTNTATNRLAWHALRIYQKWHNLFAEDKTLTLTDKDLIEDSWIIADQSNEPGGPGAWNQTNILVIGAGPNDEGGPRYLSVYHDGQGPTPRINAIILDFDTYVCKIYDGYDDEPHLVVHNDEARNRDPDLPVRTEVTITTYFNPQPQPGHEVIPGWMINWLAEPNNRRSVQRYLNRKESK